MSARPSQWGPPGGVQIGPPGPVPPVVRALLIATIAAHVVDGLLGYALREHFALVPGRLAQGEIWRLLGYLFLHGSVMHLALNMLMLWMFGSELEQRWGSRFFLRYFLLCGLAGGLVFSLTQWGTWVPTVGSSGAIYGILMAYGMWFPTRVVLVFFLFPMQVRYLIVFLMGLEFLQAMESTRTGIAHAAHLGGAAFGYAYLRWWGVSGLGVAKMPGLAKVPTLADLKRRYYRWRFRRLQKRRFGDRSGGGDGGPTLH